MRILRIPHFKKIGLTCLLLMSLFAAPLGNDDDGYAVSAYRAINPDIGTMQEPSQLIRKLRTERISADPKSLAKIQSNS